MNVLRILARPAALSLLVAGCATAPSTAPFTVALRSGDVATVEGRVTRIDTAPWAYDGSATVGIATTSGEVTVSLPARWNLCKAPSPDLQSLKAGDRVRAIGTASDAQTIVVCARAEDRLVRVD